MSNTIEQKAQTLAAMLRDNRLTKVAGDQEIEHTTPEAQTNLGKEETEKVNELEGVNAATEAAANKDSEKVDTPPNNQNLNTSGKAALANSGTSVDVMKPDGEATELKTEKTAAQAKPTEQAKTAAQTKTAAEYKRELAQTLANLRAQRMRKQAAAQPQQINPDDFRTGTEVMEKIASLSAQPTEAEMAELRDDMVKLAATNPLFNICRDQILMRKMAEDIDALAEAEGMSPEEAAAQLDAAAEADPEMMAEAEDEANAEAIAQLADAEADADDLMGGIEELAANASEATGQQVTSDDILNAIDEVQAQADELGVPPTALIQAAMEDMQGAGDAEVTPEDEANADAIMEEAAAQGVSPDEVLQMAAGELDNGEGGGEGEGSGEAAAAEAAGEAGAEGGEGGEGGGESAGGEAKGGESEGGEEKKEDGGEEEKKEASAQQKVAATPRAAYVQHLLHNAKK